MKREEIRMISEFVVSNYDLQYGIPIVAKHYFNPFSNNYIHGYSGDVINIGDNAIDLNPLDFCEIEHMIPKIDFNIYLEEIDDGLRKDGFRLNLSWKYEVDGLEIESNNSFTYVNYNWGFGSDLISVLVRLTCEDDKLVPLIDVYELNETSNVSRGSYPTDVRKLSRYSKGYLDKIKIEGKENEKKYVALLKNNSYFVINEES